MTENKFQPQEKISSVRLKEKYLEFFKLKKHAIIPSASLIPEHDPTVLFTTAGMHPLVPYLLGEKHPEGKRLASIQRCIRTGDIDDVGDSWHLTFFEMLGNWSLGDYWKKEAIEWSFEFLTDKKWLGIPPEKLSVTVFSGDKDAPADEESSLIWQSLGIPKERICYLPKEDNWWGPAGQIGPCGPCSEMFYDTGREKCGPSCKPGCKCGKYPEIWNDVFMEYNKTAAGKFEKLKQQNVDTGMGVERTTAVLNGYDNVFDTEVFAPVFKAINELTPKDYKSNQKTYRIVADHLKAAAFILAEGIEPSNVERGYVLRRLIRRAIRYGRQMAIKDIFTFKIARVIIDICCNSYPELKKNKDFIEEQLVREEEKFGQTLEKGLKEFKSQIGKCASRQLSGKAVFDLYQSFGFPLELTKELAKEEGFGVDERGFQEEFKRHQEISRAGAEQKFKSGLADHSEQVIKYHTATHLMLAALRQILGNHVFQRGSNITAERLRFDFSHPEALTAEQLQKAEDIVNQKIKEDLAVIMEEMSLEAAKKQGAIGVFESRYEERVKVYSIGDFSKEICAGPHVNRTSELGHFKIIKEESSGAGVRRIRAVLE